MLMKLLTTQVLLVLSVLVCILILAVMKRVSMDAIETWISTIIAGTVGGAGVAAGVKIQKDKQEESNGKDSDH